MKVPMGVAATTSPLPELEELCQANRDRHGGPRSLRAHLISLVLLLYLQDLLHKYSIKHGGRTKEDIWAGVFEPFLWRVEPIVHELICLWPLPETQARAQLHPYILFPYLMLDPGTYLRIKN